MQFTICCSKTMHARILDVVSDETTRLLGLGVSLLSMRELLDRSRSANKIAIEFANVHTLLEWRSSEKFRDSYRCFDYVMPDGAPLAWCLRSLGFEGHKVVRGPDFLNEIMFQSTVPLRHFIVGGNNEIIETIKAKLAKLGGSGTIVGSDLGQYSIANNILLGMDDQVFREINRLAPDFIWVSLGTPKQQYWIANAKAKINLGIICSVGFAMDVAGGQKNEVPRWMIRLGLGWFYRLLQDPIRLFSRYFISNSKFLILLLSRMLRFKNLS